MFKYIYKVLKKIYPIRIIVHFFRALIKVKIDASSLREFMVSLKGYQAIYGGNFRLYKNFFSHLHTLKHKNFCFIDVGANDGWFIKIVKRFMIDATIIAFEPLLSQRDNLMELKKKYSNIKIINKAVGKEEGVLELKEYGTSGLSSLKGLSDKYSYNQEHYHTNIINKYEVSIVRLDDEVNFKILAKTTNILKIDTQGFEMEVLEGSVKILKSGVIQYIIIELMTEEKYENSILCYDIFQFMHKYNYKIFDINQAYYEADFRLTEFDVVFILDNKIK